MEKVEVREGTEPTKVYPGMGKGAERKMFLGELRAEGHGAILSSGELVIGHLDRVYSIGAKL